MTARLRSQNAMLHGTLDLLAAARAQLAAHPRPSSGQATAEAGLSVGSMDAEFASLHEDMELKSEQLETLRQQLDIAQSQAQDCRALLQCLEAEQAARQHLEGLLQQAKHQQQDDSGASLLQQPGAGGDLNGMEEGELMELRSQHAHTCAELGREYTTSQGLADDLQQAQQAASALTRQVKELQAAVAASAESRADLVNQQQQLTAQVEELQGALAASAESRAELVEQQQQLTAQLEDEQAASQDLGADLHQRQQQVEALEAQLGGLKGALAASAEEDAGFSNKLRHLQATLAASSESRADLSDQLQRSQAGHDQVRRELQHWRASAESLARDLLDSQAQLQRSTGGAQQPAALMLVSEASVAAVPAAQHGFQQLVASTGHGGELRGGPGAPAQSRPDLVNELQQMRAPHVDAMSELRFWRESAERLAKELPPSHPRPGAPQQEQSTPLAIAAAPADSPVGDLLQQPTSEYGQIRIQLEVVRNPQFGREGRVSICILVSEAAAALCPPPQQVSLDTLPIVCTALLTTTEKR